MSPEHEREDQGCQRIIELLEQIADDPEHQHQPDVEIGVVYRIGADGAQHDGWPER